MKSNRSIIIASGVALSFLILSIASIASYVLKINSEAEWQRQAQNLSLILADHASQTFISSEVAVNNIADIIPLNKRINESTYRDFATQNSIYQMLVEKIGANPLVDVASITNSSGDVINFSRSFPPPQINLSDRDYFQWLSLNRSDQVYFSAPVKNKGNGQWTFYVSKRLENLEGGFLGTVQVGISVQNFSNFYKKVISNIGNGASVSLYKDDLTLMTAYPLKDELIGQKIIGNTKKLLVDQGLEEYVAIVQGPRLIQSDLSQTRIIAPRKVGVFPFIITPVISDNIYLKTWKNSLLSIWGIALFNLLLLFIFIRIILIRNQQINEELLEKSKAEAFLRESQEIIRQQNLELDSRVRERTKELEENQIRLKESNLKLEDSSRHKSEFLANMSHELRTPLNSVIGFSELLKEKIFGDLNEKQTDYVNDILNSGKHLLELINDVLDLAKIESGQLDIFKTVFSLNKLIQFSVAIVAERAQKAKLSLKVLVNDSQDMIYADERKLKQIIINLLTNAIKFTPAGGTITLTVQYSAEGALISVADTGIGIALEDQTKVFEEFRQVDNALTRKAEGTGLGLAIVKRLIELQGGWLKLESELGKGSTFSLFIPQKGNVLSQ